MVICFPFGFFFLSLQNCKQVLLISIMLVRSCVCLADTKHAFLVPNLWPHIYPYTTKRDSENQRHFAAFLAFAHMNNICSNENHEGNISNQVPSRLVNRIEEFPVLRREHGDMKYIHRLWHTTKEHEEKVLGDYLADTGGAMHHVSLLGELVEDMNTITTKENQEKTKPLLANMNNLSLESEKFATALCSGGVLAPLKKVLTRESLVLATMTDAVSMYSKTCAAIFWV